MKKTVFLFTFILFVFVFAAVAQEEKSKWTRFETEDKEISVSFPADVLVDATTKTNDKRYRLFGFENAVAMQLEVSKPDSPKARLKDIVGSPSNGQVSSFNFKGIEGKNYVSQKGRYHNAVHLAVGDYFYSFSISAANANSAGADRFFCSIKIKGEPLYTCKEKFDESDGAAVSLSSLTTSPKISEALNRKFGENEGKIIYELEGGDAEAKDKNSAMRPAIVLIKTMPRPRSVRFDGNILRGRHTIKLRATLLANGQVGDISVFSSLDKDYLRGFIDAARKSKFIPAEIGGKPVDSQYTFVYTVETR